MKLFQYIIFWPIQIIPVLTHAKRSHQPTRLNLSSVEVYPSHQNSSSQRKQKVLAPS